MALSSPPTAVAPFDKGRLAAGISASATSLTVSPVYKTVAGVRTKQGLNTTSGCAVISAGDYVELVTFTGISVDATTKITTVSGLTRGRDPTATTASGSFASGTGRIWAKGAKFTVVADATYFQSGVFTNVANTFSASQTFTAPILITGSTSFTGVPSMTTAQRTSLTPSQPGFVYDTDLSQFYKYEGGAWAAVATGSFSNAANNTAGKVDLATAAEVAAGTANDGTSGAANVIPVAIVKTSSTGAVNGTVPALNASVALDRTIGGLGTVTGGTAYTLIANGTTATGATQNLASAGTSNQILTSNGASSLPTFQDAKSQRKLISRRTTDGTQVASNTTNGQEIDTYTVSAGAWAAGDVWEWDSYGIFVTDGAYTVTFQPKIGGSATAILPYAFTTASGTTTNYYHIHQEFLCRTTGGTGTVLASGYAEVLASGGTNKSFAASQGPGSNQTAGTTATVDTTGTLALSLEIAFSTGSTSNLGRSHRFDVYRSNVTPF